MNNTSLARAGRFDEGALFGPISSMGAAMTRTPRKGWFKSTRSAAASHCVETAFGRAYGQAFGQDFCQVGDVHVRDSKNQRGGVLSFDSTTWAAFISGVKSGEFSPL